MSSLMQSSVLGLLSVFVRASRSVSLKSFWRGCRYGLSGLLLAAALNAHAIPTNLWTADNANGAQFTTPVAACDAINYEYGVYLETESNGNYKCYGVAVDDYGHVYHYFYGQVYKLYWCNGQYMVVDCPAGADPLPGKNMGAPQTCNVNGTNPINTGWAGNKFQSEKDFTGVGLNPLVFERFYNSRVSLTS